MQPAPKFETLHCHTTLSDGLYTHEEVLDECARHNIGTVAFTDHDILPSLEQIEKLKNLDHSVKFITGIEMTANYVAETEEDMHGFHIIGLFVDPTNAALQKHCKEVRESRIESAKRIVQNVSAAGFDLSFEDLQEHVNSGSLAKPHIARAIIAKKDNIAVLDKVMEEFRIAAEKDPQKYGAKYKKVIRHSNFDRVFDLMIGNDTFLRDVHVPNLQRVSMDEVVTLIREAGGVAILAHWSFYKNKLPADIVRKFATAKRLDGFETVYGFRSGADEVPVHFDDDMLFLKDLALENKLAQGGGGDLHTERHFAAMLEYENARYTSQSVGLLDTVFAYKPDVDLSWSTVTHPLG